MSRRAMPFGALSFLDLVCCSLGAAVLMLLIAVSADPANRPKSPQPPLIVVCRHSGGARAEVGIEFRRPNSPTWERGNTMNTARAFTFSATSEPDSGSHAVLLLTEPEIGLWEVRAYLADYPRSTKDLTPTEVTLRALGNTNIPVGEIRSALLRRPPDVGPTFAVRVQQASFH